MKKLIAVSTVLKMGIAVAALGLGPISFANQGDWDSYENSYEDCKRSFNLATNSWGDRFINFQLCKNNRILPEEIGVRSWEVPEGVVTAKNKADANDQVFRWIMKNKF